jgi:Na+/proline symporter
MQLSWLDWAVIGGYFAVNLFIGLWYHKRAAGSTTEFFISGRRASWWLAGTSMVATTFAADTPLAVTGLVASYGIAGNWLWWNLLLSNMLTVFSFARLWRRAGVVTDVEFTELRYGGPPAAFLRGFRALYLGLPINCIVLGWVNLAMVKIVLMIFPELSFPALGITDAKLAALLVVFGIMLLTTLISTIAGLWGVLVTDLFQFVLKMGMVIVLAYFAVKAVGGLEALQQKLQALDTAKGGRGSVLAFLPDVGSAWMPMIAFCVYLGVTWWATWYPGSEPGGGGFVAQRMLCAKDEKHSLLATLWFSIAHYALRPWPWILTALASLVLYPTLKDKEAGFVKAVVDPQVLPPALAGLMIAAFAAAYMSTVATQLNWGASYLINDFYRRFLVRDRDEKHYVGAAQVATLLLMVASTGVTYFQESIAGAWKFLMAVGAGTGSVLILRWFWWRINAWSEVAAMLASFVVSLVLQLGFKLNTDEPRQFAWTILITVGCCTITWVAVTLLTAPEDKLLLIAFYRRTRPNPALWRPIARAAPDVPVERDGWNNLLDWLAGSAMIYLALFGTGKIIFGQTLLGLAFLVLAALAGGIVYWDLSRRQWSVVSDEAAPPLKRRNGD